MGNRVFDKLTEPKKLHQSPILVFAGDALMAGGLRGLGRVQEKGAWRARRHAEFLQLCRDLTADGFIDGCLLTPSDAETLAVEEKFFESTPVTPMVRLNAETWIWSPRHGNYNRQLSQPFQTVPLNASPEAAFCELRGGDLECHVKIGLYSITLNNDTVADARTLGAYLDFARSAAQHPQFEYFLEVFLPNTNLPGLDREKRGQYVADSIVRALSCLKKKEKPRFIKTEFTSAATWRELCEFDPNLIVGALGGPRQNAKKTLELAHAVVTNGGRAALFGRTIFDDENPLAIVRALRAVLDQSKSVDEAFAAYQKS